MPSVEQRGNLLKSKAVMRIAPTGEALPDETSVNHGAAWGGNWVKMGWTNAPLAFNYEYDTADFELEQFLAPVKRQKTAHSATFETTLAEVIAHNLARAIGGQDSDVTETAAGASQKGYEALDIGNSPVLEEWVAGFEGTTYDSAGTAQPVRVFFPVCTIHINGELSFSQKDDDIVGIPVQVMALADTANSGKLVTWHRVTAPAT